jgi:hypothetical protein
MQFNLTLEQTNLVLQSLAQMPYHMTANLIAEIQQQAQPQLAAQQAEDKAKMQPGEPE